MVTGTSFMLRPLSSRLRLSFKSLCGIPIPNEDGDGVVVKLHPDLEDILKQTAKRLAIVLMECSARVSDHPQYLLIYGNHSASKKLNKFQIKKIVAYCRQLRDLPVEYADQNEHNEYFLPLKVEASEVYIIKYRKQHPDGDDSSEGEGQAVDRSGKKGGAVSQEKGGPVGGEKGKPVSEEKERAVDEERKEELFFAMRRNKKLPRTVERKEEELMERKEDLASHVDGVKGEDAHVNEGEGGAVQDIGDREGAVGEGGEHDTVSVIPQKRKQPHP
ncbi:hypothetical protein K435DRAFT_799949 [Dendrothele bispora CBS 962.96]|uniref:Uncharacterized protein n=1 Tax=Dendrothele bispora (strain CBS 962.96) TaxID=1314807 RepID=A0A4S8LUZ0_DENBC|nr:hypothetical protein K435DRAFT_799949 [Dendrothele bispora CBS 962.96]